MITIEYIDPIYCRVNKEGIPVLKKVLYFKDVYWRQGFHRKVQKTYQKPMIGKDGLFLTGFIPRVLDYLVNKKIAYDFTETFPEKSGVITFPTSTKNSFTLLPEQEEAVTSALLHGRGVIHYPTGSGKTVIFLSLLEALPDRNAVIITHLQSIFDQTYTEACRLFPGEVGRIGDNCKEPNRITIALIQSLNRMEPTEWHKLQDVLIIDECHHVNSTEGSYAKVLKQIPAPVRIGVTATLPDTEKGSMALEGLIGPVIAQKSIQEVSNLAKPIVKLKKLPFSQTVHDLRTWADVYRLGVVYNSRRHKQVLEDAVALKADGRTSLILVVQIEHGHNLMTMATKRFPNLCISFVWGDTTGDERAIIKRLLESGQGDCVICNAVWREGVNIPSLGAIINASGGKSEILTLQSIGRGLRTTPTKKDVILLDYFDPSHKYLIEHFGHRLTLYFEEGWL
jgi:superfamily II DNA or RNA helicase